MPGVMPHAALTPVWLLLLCLGGPPRGAAAAPGAGDAPLTLLPPGGGAGRCLDGSPGGFYLDRAAGAQARTKWLLFLQGGGECVTASSCELRLQTPLGSSQHFGRTLREHIKNQFYVSSDPAENPGFAAWNRVFLPYCSQDLWSGTRTAATADTFGMYFSGHLLIKSVVEYLKEHEDLGSATELVVGGDSAGGIGSWLNMGHIQAALPRLKRAVVAPVAGFYGFAHMYAGPGALPPIKADFSEGAWPGYVALWQSHLDPRCTAAHPSRPWACMLSNYSAPHLPYEAFVVEAQTDKLQLLEHDGLPELPPSGPGGAELRAFMDSWRQNMTIALHTRLKAMDGYFFPACFVHTEFDSNGPLLHDAARGRDATYLEAFADFYAGRAVRLEDQCGLLCGHCSQQVAVEPVPALLPPGAGIPAWV